MHEALDRPALHRAAPWRTPIDWRAKGLPALHAPLDPADVARQGWNLFDGRFLLPTMVLHEAALDHNIALIADYCRTNGVSLAPHGKTTMAPAIFERQLAAGAWAMTVATPWQARVAATIGVPRIMLANQVTDAGGIDWLATTLRQGGPEVSCWVDSIPGVELLNARLGGDEDRLPVFIEVGLPGGRAGVRSLEAALGVAARVRASTALRLAGVAWFEGVVGGADQPARDAAVRRLISLAREVAVAIDPGMGADGARELILTGCGSQYLDIVVEGLTAPLGTRSPVRGVLRSGGTVSHDDGGYDLVSPFGSVRASGGPQLRPALEVWAPVLSMPEPGRATLGAGKRDLPHDGGLPLVLAVRAPDGAVRPLTADGLRVTRLNDQHTYLELDPEQELAVGDLVALGVRHPCMAFDRWRFVPVVDEAYDVVDVFETIF
ncbi:MAG: alanine racemase [Chloroflexi bacterium]|nr:alanine racemase [Chloroflexota bacterium]